VLETARPGQVRSTDTTCIRLEKGFVHLTAVIDWHSREVLSWRLSNTLDSSVLPGLPGGHHAVRGS
jgi:putative transposase